MTTEPTVEFDFSQPTRPARSARSGPPVGFECRLDDGPWEGCEAPMTMGGIARGLHRVQVHAVNRAGETGPAAGFTWRRVAPRPPEQAPGDQEADEPEAQPLSKPKAVEAHRVEGPGGPIAQPLVPGSPREEPEPPEEPFAPRIEDDFSLEQVGGLKDLLPGTAAQTIGVRVVNPTASPISVTSLTASIPVDPPNCSAAENFVLTPAAVSPDAPLVVPAESSLSLPAAGIAGPTIAMRNLPVDQSECEEDELHIALNAEAGE